MVERKRVITFLIPAAIYKSSKPHRFRQIQDLTDDNLMTYDKWDQNNARI